MQKIKKSAFLTDRIDYLRHVMKPGLPEVANHKAHAIGEERYQQQLPDYVHSWDYVISSDFLSPISQDLRRRFPNI